MQCRMDVYAACRSAQLRYLRWGPLLVALGPRMVFLTGRVERSMGKEMLGRNHWQMRLTKSVEGVQAGSSIFRLGGGGPRRQNKADNSRS